MTAFRRTSQILMAAFAPAHELLPVAPSQDLGKISFLFRDLNINRVAFLRHGKTASSSGTDFERVLTEEGRRQTQQAGHVFGKKLNPYFDSVLVSPAPRAVETAELFLSSSDSNVNIISVDGLYDGTMQPKGSELFKKIGYAPLRQYIESQNNEDRLASQHLLGSYANICVEAMINIVSTTPPQPPPKYYEQGFTFLMVGHAVYLPAAALATSSLLGCRETNIIMDTSTGEAEGYLVDIGEKNVQYLSRHEQ